MTRPIAPLAGAVPAVQPAAPATGTAAHGTRGDRFASVLYAALRPPSLDFSEAAGDFEDDAPQRPPMRAHVQPNLAKALGLDPATAANLPAPGARRPV
ncbi:hypothetical protein [Methylobacterium oryzihabitans]|uniref:Uncharacterized protein n=1 Tax=Methylobacterium oryzihabitans TaxID=2499852 RepID=A0A3S2YIW5_9HYPH|nr:hypothetical protein [Methylobacterium oryzihabitans]RVU11986.1 hypothetical protein EOE48_28180 [Methylobacterium oryzihabitans]